MIQNILNYLNTVLTANSLIQKVYLYERADAEGTPFATVTLSANENEYASTTQNQRTYAFLVRLYVDRKGQRNPEAADPILAELVDSVLDDLDKNYNMSGLVVNSGYTFLMMEAAPSQWGYVGREMEYRVAEVIVRVRFYVDTTVIS